MKSLSIKLSEIAISKNCLRIKNFINAKRTFTRSYVSITKKNYNSMGYNSKKIDTNKKDYFKDYIELRSDVKTIPTQKMLENIQNCLYGDDCFDEDPTTEKLLQKLCNLFKKESALFVPSGTMGNMVCLSLYAERGDFIFQGLKSHIFKTELPSQKLLGFRPLTCPLLDSINPTASKFDMDHQTNFKIEQFSISKAINDFAESNNVPKEIQVIDKANFFEAVKHPKIVALENTHNYNGGVIIDRQYFKEFILPEKENFNKKHLINFETKNKIAFHLDGSRVLNASVASNLQPSLLTEDFETVNICLSKALGAPCGSVIFFESKHYEKAKGIVKALGGGMRQNGVLAAAALTALEDYEERFSNDHFNAGLLAHEINEIKGLNCPEPQTNIVNVYFDKDYFHQENLADKFEEYLLKKHRVLTHSFEGGKYIRCVLHHQVDYNQVKIAIKGFEDGAAYFNDNNA